MGTAPLANGSIGEPVKEPTTDHDAKGRFVRGNRGGPGNPHARRVAALRQRLLDYMTDERLEQLAEQLFQQATNGDLAATKLLFSYVLGAPPPATIPDRMDLDELQLLREVPQSVYALRGGQAPAALTVVLLRGLQEVEGEAALAAAARKAQKQAARLELRERGAAEDVPPG